MSTECCTTKSITVVKKTVIHEFLDEDESLIETKYKCFNNWHARNLCRILKEKSGVNIAKTLIDTRFDLVTSFYGDEKHQIARYKLPETPSIGELINIKGQPYKVVDKGWAIGCDGLYCYINLLTTEKVIREME